MTRPLCPSCDVCKIASVHILTHHHHLRHSFLFAFYAFKHLPQITPLASSLTVNEPQSWIFSWPLSSLLQISLHMMLPILLKIMMVLMVTMTMMMMTTVAGVARPHAHLWPRGAPLPPQPPSVPRRKSVAPSPPTGHVHLLLVSFFRFVLKSQSFPISQF